MISSGKLIPCFVLLAFMAFALPIELSLFQLMNFFVSTLQILLPNPHPTRKESEWQGNVFLPDGL